MKRMYAGLDGVLYGLLYGASLALCFWNYSSDGLIWILLLMELLLFVGMLILSVVNIRYFCRINRLGRAFMINTASCLAVWTVLLLAVRIMGQILPAQEFGSGQGLLAGFLTALFWGSRFLIYGLVSIWYWIRQIRQV